MYELVEVVDRCLTRYLTLIAEEEMQAQMDLEEVTRKRDMERRELERREIARKEQERIESERKAKRELERKAQEEFERQEKERKALKRHKLAELQSRSQDTLQARARLLETRARIASLSETKHQRPDEPIDPDERLPPPQSLNMNSGAQRNTQPSPT